MYLGVGLVAVIFGGPFYLLASESGFSFKFEKAFGHNFIKIVFTNFFFCLFLSGHSSYASVGVPSVVKYLSVYSHF